MYTFGKGVSQYNKEAANWIQLAMEQDNKLAQGELDMLPSKKVYGGRLKIFFKYTKR